MKYILLVVSAVLLSCGVSPTDFPRIMKQEGITDFRDEGYAWFGCSKDDTFHTKFSGRKNNQPVSGFVCAGLPKGYTIRYN